MATNPYFNQGFELEQDLYETIVIEALQYYGQDMIYIPRSVISSDEILNEEYSRFKDTYEIEMYIANTEAFEGEGNLLTKFGLEIRDQATFIVSRKRFKELVASPDNEVAGLRPNEGDLIYLPMSNSLFEIRFVEHESPFYQIKNLPTFQLQCELFEYTGEQFNTGLEDIDEFELKNGPQIAIALANGTSLFSPGDRVEQEIANGDIIIYGEVVRFDTESNHLFLTQVNNSMGTLSQFQITDSQNSVLHNITTGESDWSISQIFTIGNNGLPGEPLSQNDRFKIDAEDIVDWSEMNPFGEI